jgi:hypothetical protein
MRPETASAKESKKEKIRIARPPARFEAPTSIPGSQPLFASMDVREKQFRFGSVQKSKENRTASGSDGWQKVDVQLCAFVEPNFWVQSLSRVERRTPQALFVPADPAGSSLKSR